MPGSATLCGRRRLLQALLLAPWAWRASAGEVLAGVFGAIPDPARVTRVLTAGPPAGVLVYCLAPDKLLGWSQPLGPQALAWVAPHMRTLPFLGRLSGRGSTLSAESLLALAPDLILDAGTVNDTYRSAARRVQEQTGVPYVLVDGRLADSAAQLRQVGRLLGVERRGEQLAAHAQAVLDLAQRLASRAAGPRIYFARGRDGLETGLRGAIHTEVLQAAGGRNVADALGDGGLARVSLEQLLAWDPDMILGQDAAVLAHIRSDSGWRALRAVREGQVHGAPVLPFGWLDGPPGVNRLLGLHWLLPLLYPDAGLPTPVAAARDFFSLFYGFTPEAGALERLLVESA